MLCVKGDWILWGLGGLSASLHPPAQAARRMPAVPALTRMHCTAHTPISSEPCPHTHSGALHPCQPCSGMGAVPLGAASFFSSRTRDAVHRWDALQPSPKPCGAVRRALRPCPAAKGQGWCWECWAAPEGTVSIAAAISAWAHRLWSPSHKQIPRTASVGNEGVNQGCFQAIFLSHRNPPPPQQLSLPLCLK